MVAVGQIMSPVSICLILQFAVLFFYLKPSATCIKTGRPQTQRAIEQVEQRLSKDGWPEYYDGKAGRYIGKQARKYQTWSISGYLVAKLMIENPANLSLISLEEDKKIAKPRLTRSASFCVKPVAAAYMMHYRLRGRQNLLKVV
ncbi:cytosolic invertase 1-like [Prunus persica]|uniref:cytosolic invertase 1-like n=1 Tax=Prunus persica TaxID=3760 RepID=UPI0009AB3D54|nr:cytosolic invertase 1-like [Prunus persica]